MNRLISLLSIALLSCGGGSSTYPTPSVPPPQGPPEPVAQPQPEPAPAPQAQPQELAFPAEDWRKERPTAGEPRPFKLPEIKTFKLDSGIEVYLVERHTLPTVSMTLAFDGGAVNDPKGKEGLAYVCMDLMAEGTKRLDKIAFAEAQADLASNVGAGAGTEEQAVWMSTLTKNLDPTLDLWVEMLIEPGFRESDFKRGIARRKEQLKQIKGSAASVAGRVGDSVLYGLTHPFGRVTSDAAYDAITLADCSAYHATWLKPKGARLFVVGDITEADLRAKVGKRLAGFTGKAKASKKPGGAKPRRGAIFFVDVPGAKQSVVRMMHLGPKRTAPDYLPTTLMARILGGGFSSRINMNLREDKGWAYGARGGFSYNRDGSTFGAGGSFHTEHTKNAILEVYAEVQQMATQKKAITDEELAREQEGEVLGLPGDFATAGQTLGQFRNLIWYGLPLTYYNTYVDRVQKVTKRQVVAAARKHLKPNKLAVLVVGDGAAVLPGLLELTADKTFGSGNLVILDTDGNVVEEITPKEAKKRAEAKTN